MPHQPGYQRTLSSGPSKRTRLACVIGGTRLCLHMEWRKGNTVSASRAIVTADEKNIITCGCDSFVILGTMKLAADAFTMALTLPGGDVAGLGHEIVGKAFEKVLRRLSVKQRFAGVSGFWKRELQKRGAIHYHLLLYGLAEDGLRSEFQAWLVARRVSFFAAGLDEKEREHHRWWHARPENMQLVRDFSGYFAKHLGKDGDAGGLPGRWWGSLNKRCLPVAARSEESVSMVAAVRLHRLARKWRQKNMDAGKHCAGFARMKKCGMLNLTETDLRRLRSGYDLDGNRNPVHAVFSLNRYRHA